MVAATAAIQPGLSEPRVPYAGIATRAVALAADLLVIHLFILIVGALLGLVASLVGDLRRGEQLLPARRQLSAHAQPAGPPLVRQPSCRAVWKQRPRRDPRRQDQ